MDDRLHLLIDCLSDGMATADEKGIIVEWSQSLEKISGFSAEEMVGESVREVLSRLIPEGTSPEGFGRQGEDSVQRGLGSEVLFQDGLDEERTLKCKDGSLVPIRLRGRQLKTDQGFTLGLVITQESRRSQDGKANSRLATIVESSHDAMCAFTLDGVITDWNPAAEWIYGFTADEMVGRSVFETVDADQIGQFQFVLDKVKKEALPQTLEVSRARKDGAVFDLILTVCPIIDSSGEIVGISGVAHDISDRKRADETLRSSEERYSRFVENVTDMIYRLRFSPYPELEYVSPAAFAVLGYTPDELYANRNSAFDTVHPDDLGILLGLKDDPPVRGQPIVLRMIRKDGGIIWIELRAIPIIEEGRLVALEGICRDITERKNAEEERERLLVREQALSNIGRTLVNEIDPDKVVQAVLKQGLELPGVDGIELYVVDETKDDVLRLLSRGFGETCSVEVVVGERLSVFEDGLAARAARTAEIQKIDDLGDGLEGQRGRIFGARSAIAVPLLVQDRLVGVITSYSCTPGYFSSVSEEPISAIADLFAVALEKARLYQELRARERQVDLLLKRTIDAQEEERQRICLEIQDNVAQVLSAAISHLGALHFRTTLPDGLRSEVRDITNLVESGLDEVREMVATLRPKSLDVLGLVATLRHELRVLSSESGLPIELDARELKVNQQTGTVLYRIVREGLNNVIKHAKASMARVRMVEEKGSVVVEIQDDGVGFDASNVGRQTKPNGVGLIGIRERAELLGGTLIIRSSPGKGTFLRVEIPLSGLSQTSSEATNAGLHSFTEVQDEQQVEPITILIADDHMVARRGLRAMIETNDAFRVVGEAADGQEAFEAVTVLHPQVVLMDVRMPKMDGLEATRRIKAEYPTSAVIVLTSLEDDALVMKAIQAGAAGFLLKGASCELLHQTIFSATSGGLLVEAGLLRQAIGTLAKHRESDASCAQTDVLLHDVLTDREMVVLRLMAEGRTNKEIGEELGYAEITVKKYVQNIIAKLGASDRTHAAIMALRRGLID